MIKSILFATLVAAALADNPQPDPYKAPEPYNAPEPAYAPPSPPKYAPPPPPPAYKPPPPAYKPAPAPYRPPAYKPARPAYKEEPLPPQPFQYQYGVRDDYTGADFDKQEEQDAYGNVAGEYRVNLPDGRVQIVTYTAAADGFNADVRYEGEAQYPPEPKEGYGYKPPHPAPTYGKPAPSYAKPAPTYAKPAPSYAKPDPPSYSA